MAMLTRKQIPRDEVVCQSFMLKSGVSFSFWFVEKAPQMPENCLLMLDNFFISCSIRSTKLWKCFGRTTWPWPTTSRPWITAQIASMTWTGAAGWIWLITDLNRLIDTISNYRDRKEPQNSFGELLSFVEGAYRLLQRIQRLNENSAAATDASDNSNILQTWNDEKFHFSHVVVGCLESRKHHNALS